MAPAGRSDGRSRRAAFRLARHPAPLGPAPRGRAGAGRAPPPAGGGTASARATAPSPQPTVTVGARFTPARHASAVLSSRPVHVGGKLLPATPGPPGAPAGRGAHGWHTLSTGAHRGPGRLSPERRARDADGQPAADGVRRRRPQRVTRCARPAASPCCTPALASWYDDARQHRVRLSRRSRRRQPRRCRAGRRSRFRYGGRTVTAVVDDRGPYAGGRDWDLNQTTAAALGFGGVGTVWSTGSRLRCARRPRRRPRRGPGAFAARRAA